MKVSIVLLACTLTLACGASSWPNQRGNQYNWGRTTSNNIPLNATTGWSTTIAGTAIAAVTNSDDSIVFLLGNAPASLSAVSSAGSVLWQFLLAHPPAGITYYNSGLYLAMGNVIICFRDDQAIAWTMDLPEPATSYPIANSDDGLIYITTATSVYGWNTNGDIVHNITVTAAHSLGGLCFFPGVTRVALATASDTGMAWLVNMTLGTVDWSVSFATPAAAAVASFYSFYVATTGGELLMLVLQGEVLENYTLNAAVNAAQIPAYSFTVDSSVVVMTATGLQSFKELLPGHGAAWTASFGWPASASVVASSLDVSSVLSGDDMGTVRLINGDNGDILWELTTHKGYVLNQPPFCTASGTIYALAGSSLVQIVSGIPQPEGINIGLIAGLSAAGGVVLIAVVIFVLYKRRGNAGSADEKVPIRAGTV